MDPSRPETRTILARYDERGIDVYQAFRPEIAEEALRRGRFGTGFNLDRMTWIKPSWGWMLYRSGYATKARQERILSITLAHEGFQAILRAAVPTTFDPRLFGDERAWKSALDGSEARYQWDPDRDWRLRRLDRRALQVGIRGGLVRDYVESWTLVIQDRTPLAHQCPERDDCGEPTADDLPVEREYPVPADIERILGMR